MLTVPRNVPHDTSMVSYTHPSVKYIIPVRSIVKARAGGRCETCGTSYCWRGFEIAHLVNVGMGGSKKLDKPEDVQYLCKDCHDVSHGIKVVRY